MKQLLQLCGKIRCQRSLYLDVQKLARSGYLTRVSHPERFQIVLMATEMASAMVYSPKYVRPRKPRLKDLNHMLGCASLMFELTRYSNVTGIATEFELTPGEVKDFSLARTPDGIVQVTGPDGIYELAVEYEAYQKDASRVAKILETYEAVFKGGAQCAGLIIIAEPGAAFEQYKKILTSKTEGFRQRVILKMPNEISNLNPSFFGTLLPRGSNACANTLQKARLSCIEGISYSPLISVEPSLSRPPIDTDIEGQSVI